MVGHLHRQPSSLRLPPQVPLVENPADRHQRHVLLRRLHGHVSLVSASSGSAGGGTNLEVVLCGRSRRLHGHVSLVSASSSSGGVGNKPGGRPVCGYSPRRLHIHVSLVTDSSGSAGGGNNLEVVLCGHSCVANLVVFMIR